MTSRKGEPSKGWFRSDRFYRADGQWYFTTREMIEKGPFSSRQDAEGELLLFMRNCQLEHTELARPTTG
jgi:hypothetical protein